MNEQKLNELVEQSITKNETDWPDFRKSLTGSGSLYLHIFAETLIKLTARECIKITLEHDPLYGSSIDQDIERLLGVKE